jgi:SAM-dependent methyltransferase
MGPDDPNPGGAGVDTNDVDAEAARRLVAEHPLWYHTMEVAPGVVTPGAFDLRPIVDLLPWPNVRGKRCLDVGPWDGFFSFELERRGAAEVVAADISDPTEWDWAYADRKVGPRAFAAMAGPEVGAGFRVAKSLLGSSSQRVECSVYDLTPERVGHFEVVVCGSLLLHLRDPVRALEAIRGVCREHFLSAEQVSLRMGLTARRLPVAVLRGGERGQWLIPNVAGHRLLVQAAGFEVECSIRPYAVPYGPAHPARKRPFWALREGLLSRLLAGGAGVPHAALLARPRP